MLRRQPLLPCGMVPASWRCIRPTWSDYFLFGEAMRMVYNHWYAINSALVDLRPRRLRRIPGPHLGGCRLRRTVELGCHGHRNGCGGLADVRVGNPRLERRRGNFSSGRVCEGWLVRRFQLHQWLWNTGRKPCSTAFNGSWVWTVGVPTQSETNAKAVIDFSQSASNLNTWVDLR